MELVLNRVTKFDENEVRVVVTCEGQTIMSDGSFKDGVLDIGGRKIVCANMDEGISMFQKMVMEGKGHFDLFLDD